MWIEINNSVYVNLAQVSAIVYEHSGWDHFYRFHLTSGAVLSSHVFKSEEEAKEWLQDEVLPYMERR